MKLLLACLFWTTIGALFHAWGRVTSDETWRFGRRLLNLGRSALAAAPGWPIKEPPEGTSPPIHDPESEDDAAPPPQPPTPVPPVTPVP